MKENTLNNILKQCGYSDTDQVSLDVWALKHGVIGAKPKKKKTKWNTKEKYIPLSYSRAHSEVRFTMPDENNYGSEQWRHENYKSKLF
jgi:hypothetical protein